MARAVGQIPTQADRRRNMTLTDVHGRKYFAVIEKSSGYPTGLVQPLFEAPDPRLIPPLKYMRFPEERPGFLDIDYAGWEADAKASEQEWEQNRAQIISELPGGAQNPMLHRHLGPRPINHKIVRSMRQGNRWALGFTKIRPEGLDALGFPEPQVPADDLVLNETDPVFAEDQTEAGSDQQPTATLAELLADVMKRCPENLRGAARKSWAMQELERMATEETATQEA